MRVSGVNNSAAIKTQISAEGGRTTAAEPEASANPGMAGGRGSGTHSNPTGHETAGVATGSSVARIYDGIALIEVATDGIDRIISALREAKEIIDNATSIPETDRARHDLNSRFQARLRAADTIATETRFKGYPILSGNLGCVLFYTRRAPKRRLCINLAPPVSNCTIGVVTTALSDKVQAVIALGDLNGAYTTPPITDLNFFTTPRHVELVIDGTPVPLQQDWSGQPEKLAQFIESCLNSAHSPPSYTVRYRDGRFTLASSRGVAPKLTSPSLYGIGFLGGRIVQAATPPQLTLNQGDLSIRPGSGPSFEIIGTFKSPEALAAAIDSRVENARAHLTRDGRLMLTSVQAMTITGAKAHSPFGLGFSASHYAPSGNLSDCDLLDRAGCHLSGWRVESALRALEARRKYFADTLRHFYAELQHQTLRRYSHTATHHDPVSASGNAAHTHRLIQQYHGRALQSLSRVTSATAKLLLDHERNSHKLTLCLARCEIRNGVCE